MQFVHKVICTVELSLARLLHVRLFQYLQPGQSIVTSVDFVVPRLVPIWFEEFLDILFSIFPALWPRCYSEMAILHFPMRDLR